MSYLNRHIGSGDVNELCDAVGVADLEGLLAAAVPAAIFEESPSPQLPEARDEAAVVAQLRALAAMNTPRISMIGQGYYDTVTPAVIQRNVLENPAWYTAYTPYQPEISQGRLEALLLFQTMVSDLVGLPVAGASLLDESTAVAEAMLLARRASKVPGSRFLVDLETFAQTQAVLATRAEPMGIELVPFGVGEEASFDGVFGVFLQREGASGRVASGAEIRATAEAAHEAGAILAVGADLLAASLLATPGSLGADVVAGTTQRFGVPLGFGGPHAGYLAVSQSLARQLPGRLVGISRDADGAEAYRLALQTREQHIRRDRATSNICTAQVLLAVMAAFYAVWHGPEGLAAIARRVHSRAAEIAAGLGDRLINETFFDTLTIAVDDADAALAALARRNIRGWRASDRAISLSTDERTTPEIVADVLDTLGGGGDTPAAEALPADLERSEPFLTHPSFHRYRSETAMMRYLRSLSDKDYALDRGMIPLGSCTMKLNSAVEMGAITWPEFASIHPFAPAEDAEGYRQLISDLEAWLCAVTGYDAASMQPNAGSQGELAGLLAIRAYHHSRGEDERTICLIPSSAHGTNAASAVLAGLRVVVVACDSGGNVDVADLRRLIEAHQAELAAIMITYPSTHGVYEQDIRTICDLVHEAGGQVYIDGANMNALVGVARPGAFGGDVSHLNLHKTFAIPHGGGGPGVGPVVAKAHLADFLPGHPLDPFRGRVGGAVAAAPHGSASILPITWAYISLLGGDGLREATARAVLAANYVVARLRDNFPILYRGQGGLVAHECIVDLRELKAKTGISVDDVAKRLIDYGFHAPTMSFPVAGTLMVEPTESEDRAELDRFCDAMNAIFAEAMAVADGQWPAHDNPLVGAPHTARAALLGEWEHPYSREVAVYPGARAINRTSERAADELISRKYWPPVRRIDGAYGDRNLVCTCPPIEALSEE